MAGNTDIFGAGGIADSTTPMQNNPTNRVSDFNLVHGGFTAGKPFLYRGYIQSVDGTKQPRYFGFHYNPTEINFAYDFDESQLTPEALGAENGGVPNLVGGASVSFTMRLDRTLELAAVSQGPDSPGNLGVIHDMRVLQKLVGGLDSGTTSKSNGQIISIPVNVVFSNQLGNATNPSQSTLTSTGLNFRGYLTSFQVTFTQFNYLMVPSRAEVGVTVRKVFEPATDSTSANNSAVTTPAGSQPGFSAGGLGRNYTPAGAVGGGGGGGGGGSF